MKFKLAVYQVLTFILLFTSCERKAYPEEAFQIDKSFRDLIKPYHIGDTLIFRNSKNEIDSFIITKIDSSILNSAGLPITPRCAKCLSVSYRQFPIDKWAHSWIEMGAGNKERKKISQDATLIDICKYPDNGVTQFNFNFKISIGCELEKTGYLYSDSININGIKLANFYKIEYCNKDVIKPTDIKLVYSTINKGIFAYQYKDGTLWVRVN